MILKNNLIKSLKPIEKQTVRDVSLDPLQTTLIQRTFHFGYPKLQLNPQMPLNILLLRPTREQNAKRAS